MSSALAEGFFWVIGGFLAFVLIFVIIGILFYYGLQTGMIKNLAVGAIKHVIAS